MAKQKTAPQTILITGASSGIGQALALVYAKAGITLYLQGRDEARLQQIKDQTTDRGADVQTALVDVTNTDGMKDWMIACDQHKPVDLIIANAGVSGGTAGHYKTEPADQVRHIFDVNVTGVLNTIEPLLETMIKRNHGQIAIMSSLASFSGWGGAPAYCSSKAAVRVYGEALRLSLHETDVKVNVICPGFIKTPMTDVNNFKMPFLMSADKAATKIKRGLNKDKGRICFPFPTYLMAGFMGLLPFCMSEKITEKMPEKPALEKDS